MFGAGSFAEAPFASQAAGGVVYDVDLVEAGVATVVFASSAVFAPLSAETGSGSEIVNTINNIFNNVITETGLSTAVVAAQGNFLAGQSEVATGVMASTAQADMVAQIQELITGIDVTVPQAVFVAALAEIATGLDIFLGGASFFPTVEETASGTDSQSAQVVFVGTVSELGNAIETLTPLRIANVFPSGVQLIISVNGVLIWAVIPTDQVPNWVEITTPQSTNWVTKPT